MINTNAVNFDVNPNSWLSDPRVQQHLPREYVLDFINLCLHAMKLHATTGSDYINGEFSYSTALVMVPDITADAFNVMEDAHLVSQIDSDRWAVDFITSQTSHEALQNSADGKARAAKTRQANLINAKDAEHAAEERAQRKREQAAERKRRQRERNAEPRTAVDDERQPQDEPAAIASLMEFDRDEDAPDWAPSAKLAPTPDPMCPECSEPVTPGAPSVIGDNDVHHMRCYTIVYNRELLGVAA